MLATVSTHVEVDGLVTSDGIVHRYYAERRSEYPQRDWKEDAGPEWLVHGHVRSNHCGHPPAEKIECENVVDTERSND